MSNKTSKMLRKMKANDKKAKELWGSLNHIQHGKVRATFTSDGPEEAVVTFMEQLFGKKFNVERD